PKKNCLGYWTNPNDWAEWKFSVVRPGTYDVFVDQGCGSGQGGSEAAVELGGERFLFTVEETGHFQIFLPRRVGRVNIPRPGSVSLAIRPIRKQAAAVMDIREVRLEPVPVQDTANRSPSFPGRRSLWHGFERYDFEIAGHPATVVAPARVATGRPWL